MRIRGGTVLPILLALLLALTTVGAAAADAGEDRVDIVALFDDGVRDPGRAARNVARDHGARLGFVYEHALRGFSASVPVSRLAGLTRDPRVAVVEADVLFHTTTLPTGVDRIEVDRKLGVPTTTGDPVTANVDIAVLDTGISPHPDLNLAGGTNCAGGSPFRRSCDDSGSYSDGNGHGTHVAGTAAGKDRSGAVGVAPGARLWAVKVLRDDGSGQLSWIAAGLDWVAARNSSSDTSRHIEVANMSLGCECTSSVLDEALDGAIDSGAVVVAAAGNANKDASSFSPARHPRVISVGALADFDGKAGGVAAPTCRSDEDDTRANFSNFGSTVDLAAPGVCIRSTWPGGGYNTISGTSMASPHVAGAAALYVVEAAVPKTSGRWQAVRDGLRSSAWSVAPAHRCGYTEDGKPIGRLLMLDPDGCEVAGVTPGSPTVTITAPADGATFASGATITFTGSATGADGQTDLSSNIAWGSSLDGPLATGASIDATLTDGTHTVTASVTDGGVTASASITVTVGGNGTVGPPSGGSMSVTIGWSARGGPTNNRHLTATFTVTDDGGAPVSGATVRADIFRNGGKVLDFTGTTGSNGTTSVTLMNAGSGCYTATVTDVAAPGLTWDGVSPPDSGICK